MYCILPYMVGDVLYITIYGRFLEQLEADLAFLADCNVFDYSLVIGIGLHRQGQPAMARLFEAYDKSEMYYCGIVDTLTAFDCSQRLKSIAMRTYASIQCKSPCCISPTYYAHRLSEFVKANVLIRDQNTTQALKGTSKMDSASTLDSSQDAEEQEDRGAEAASQEVHFAECVFSAEDLEAASAPPPHSPLVEEAVFKQSLEGGHVDVQMVNAHNIDMHDITSSEGHLLKVPSSDV